MRGTRFGRRKLAHEMKRRMYFSLFLFSGRGIGCFFFCFSFVFSSFPLSGGLWGEGDKGALLGQIISVCDRNMVM